MSEQGTPVSWNLCARCAELEAQLATVMAELDEYGKELEREAEVTMELQAQVREHQESERKLDDMWRHRMQALAAELAEARKERDQQKANNRSRLECLARMEADNKRLREALILISRCRDGVSTDQLAHDTLLQVVVIANEAIDAAMESRQIGGE